MQSLVYQNSKIKTWPIQNQTPSSLLFEPFKKITQDKLTAPTPVVYFKQKSDLNLNRVAPVSTLGAIDPAPMDKDKRKVYQGEINYQDTTGRLFVRGADETDIIQGEIGDCYFVASLSAIASVHKEWIEQMVRPLDKPNSYEVTFHPLGGKSVTINIDDDLLETSTGQLLYSRSRNAKELWVSLIEKAYAVYKGGYEAIGEGGNPALALQDLLGVPAVVLTLDKATLSETAKNNFVQFIKQSSLDKIPIVAGTISAESFKSLKATTQTQMLKIGLAPAHAYTVLGADIKDGIPCVQLRNPWGKFEYHDSMQDSKNDGVFWIPVEDFKTYFMAVFMPNPKDFKKQFG